MESGPILAVLARWFPHAGIRVSRAGTGVSTPVFRVRVDEETFWARLGEEAGERRDGEIAAHRLMSARGLPVPAVVRYEASPPELDRSIALTTHIPGVPLSTLQPKPWFGKVAFEVGRTLARINAIEVTGFGWAHASGRGGAPVGECPSRDAWALEYRAALGTIEASGILPAPVMRAVARAVGAWINTPDSSIARLAHGDFDASHLHVDPDRRVLTGIIDFGELRGADPLYDLGHLLLHDREPGRPELFPDVFRGYAEISSLPNDAVSRIRIEAIAIGMRALAIQVGRPPSPYRSWLAGRLVTLAESSEEHDAPM